MRAALVDVQSTAYVPTFSWRFLAPRYWLIWLGLLLLWLSLYLPRPLWNAVGAGLGYLYYRFNRKRRCIATANVNACFPDLNLPARERLVRAHFRIAMQSVLDLGWLWWAPRARLQRFVRFIGMEHYRDAVARGHRVVLLTCHSPAMEMGALISLHYHQVAMFKPLNNELVNWLIARGRARFGATLYVRKNALRPILRGIKAGSGFYYLPDEDLGGHDSVFVSFFGQPAATLTTLGRIAERTDAIVLPYFARRRDNGRGYELTIQPPIQNFPSGDKTIDAQHMNAVIEAGVRMAPAQYLWTFKRFKNRPPGVPGLYDGC